MRQAEYKTNTPGLLTIEICADSIQSALAAEAGGAARVELCSSLSEGGLTPSAGMIEIVRKNISIGLHVLIRPRRGDFLYSGPELEVMKKDIALAKALGADGVVLGMLKKDGSIETAGMQELIRIARPLSITFHRAFDLCADPYKALDDLISLKVDRLLTSGQQPTALQGAALIRDLVKSADRQLIIMPGGGITPENIREIVDKTAAREFHTSGRKKISSEMNFQRRLLSMSGTDTFTEYELLVADPARIHKIQEAGKQTSFIEKQSP